MLLHRQVAFFAVVLAPSLFTAPAAFAQASRSAPMPMTSRVGRAELRAQAEAAESTARSADAPARVRRLKEYEAATLRERLRDGDFQAGDRIAITVEGIPALTDTFPVRGDQTVTLPDIGAVSLRGVLRSELQDSLAAHLHRYVKTRRITATALVRVAVLGHVLRPGFYAVRADALLTDLVMIAGGPAPNADVTRVDVSRGDVPLWSRGEIQHAMATGLTLDQLSVRTGDQVVIGERRTRNWGTVMQAVGVISGVAMGLLALSR